MELKKLIKENSSFIKNILLTTVFGATISFLNYLFNVYLARNISEQDFSLYNAALGLIYLVQIPAMAIQAGITKKVASNKDFNLQDFKRKSLLQFTIISLILSIIFFILREQISQVSNLPVKYMLPLTVVLFSAILSPLTKGFLLGLEKILTLNIVTLIETVLKFAMAMLAIKLSTDITLPILANCLPALLSMVVLLPFVNTKSTKLPKAEISLDFKNILLMFVTFFLLNTPYTLDLVLVNPEFRAEYGALSLVGKIVYFAAITIASVMFARLSNGDEKSRKRTLLISLVFTALTGISLSVLFYFFNGMVVDIMFKGMYTDIASYVPLYSLAMTAYAIAYMIINSFMVKDSFIHIYFLLALTTLQVILFRLNNSSIQDAFNNQIIVYGILTIFVFVVLIYNILKNGKNKNSKKDR